MNTRKAPWRFPASAGLAKSRMADFRAAPHTPLAASEYLQQAMHDADQAVELYVCEGDDRNLVLTISLAMQRTLEFFDEYLKGA